MNNKTLMWVALAAAAYFLLSKPSGPPAPGAGQPDPLKSGLNFDPLTGGYCYPSNFSGTYIGPYPNC